jgi:hypothetical protein
MNVLVDDSSFIHRRQIDEPSINRRLFVDDGKNAWN